MKRLAAALLLTAAFAAGAADPVAWKAEVAPTGAVKPGAKFTIKLVAKIEPGWHMYSMKPVPEGPIPTRIWMQEGQPFRLAGSIRASRPRTVQDPTFAAEVELYDDSATFTVPVEAGTAAPTGPQVAVVSTSYQTCDNTICLPPKTVKVEVPVAIAR